MRHIIPISGKDSLATAIIQRKINPALDYEFIFNDTGLELPETYEWLESIQKKLDVNILTIGESLLDIIWAQGILPSFNARFCTRMSKIYPMEDYLNGDEAMVYFGIRYDERRRAGYKPSKKTKIIPTYPLIKNQIGLNGVYKIVPQDLLPPDFFWQRLFDIVKKMVTPLELTVDNLTDTERRTLFSWRSRPNCYNCFFMRYYEVVGLHEFHPDLFWKSVELEDTTGGDGYTIKEKSFTDIIKESDYYINRRAKQVAKLVKQIAQKSIFGTVDDLDNFSCGLFCGK